MVRFKLRLGLMVFIMGRVNKIKQNVHVLCFSLQMFVKERFRRESFGV